MTGHSFSMLIFQWFRFTSSFQEERHLQLHRNGTFLRSLTYDQWHDKKSSIVNNSKTPLDTIALIVVAIEKTGHLILYKDKSVAGQFDVF